VKKLLLIIFINIVVSIAYAILIRYFCGLYFDRQTELYMIAYSKDQSDLFFEFIRNLDTMIKLLFASLIFHEAILIILFTRTRQNFKTVYNGYFFSACYLLMPILAIFFLYILPSLTL
jgi:hypothetical protein